MVINRKVFWLSPVGECDDFKDVIEDVIYDGRTTMGPWALMTPKSFRQHGLGRTGLGLAQKYEKQPDGRWLKVEG
jgi:hypothetical protein